MIAASAGPSTKPSRASAIAGAITWPRPGLPKSGQRQFEPLDRARHADRAPADQARARGDGAVLVEIHAGGRGAGRGLAKVDEAPAAVGHADGHEAAAAEIAAAGIGDGLGIGDGDGGIDRVAARPQDRDAGLGRLGRVAHHHAGRAFDRLRRHRAGRTGCRQGRRDKERRQSAARHDALPGPDETGDLARRRSVLQPVAGLEDPGDDRRGRRARNDERHAEADADARRRHGRRSSSGSR